MNTEAPTVIDEVTVYPSEARISRRGTATLTVAGEQTMTVAGLPDSIDADTVRASAKGPVGVKVTGVEIGYGLARQDGQVQQLRIEVDRLQDGWRELDDDEAVINEELDQIARMRKVNAKRLSSEPLAELLDQADVTTARLSERSSAARTRRREIASFKRAVTRELDAARTALVAAEGGAVERTTRQVVVGLDAPEPGEVEITVSYVVHGAYWNPLYDARLTDAKLTLGYLASVQQTSGEDWPAVALTLSTARPAAARVLPDPDPWYVSLPQPILAQSAMVAPRAAADMTLAYGAAPVPTAAAAMVEATSDSALIDQTGAARVFRAARPVAVPSDGAPRRVPIAELRLPAEVDHVCAPRHGAEVHVRAKIINTSAVTLLSGTAAVFRDDEFVGRTELELVAPGEEIELHLGVEDRITVERELVRRDARKAGLINASGRTVLAYQTKINNFRPGSARLVLMDQVPVARDPAVSVKVGDVRPSPTRTDDLGRFEWDLDLTPGTEMTVRIEFSVEGPRDKPIIGLGL